MGVALDSNVLVRYFTKDHTRLLTKAEAIINTATSGSLVIDRIIIAEVGYVLRSVYGTTKEGIIAVYKVILSNEVFAIIDRDLVASAIGFFETEKPLSFEDCWLLALRRSGKVSAIHTFDEALSKRL